MVGNSTDGVGVGDALGSWGFSTTAGQFKKQIPGSPVSVNDVLRCLVDRGMSVFLIFYGTFV